MIDWDEQFKTCRLTSGPKTHGLTVSKIRPNGTGARSIWNDENPIIMSAANQYGFSIVLETPKIVSFIKPSQ